MKLIEKIKFYLVKRWGYAIVVELPPFPIYQYTEIEQDTWYTFSTSFKANGNDISLEPISLIKSQDLEDNLINNAP